VFLIFRVTSASRRSIEVIESAGSTPPGRRLDAAGATLDSVGCGQDV
jgi:hypothetical protein